MVHSDAENVIKYGLTRILELFSRCIPEAESRFCREVSASLLQ